MALLNTISLGQKLIKLFFSKIFKHDSKHERFGKRNINFLLVILPVDVIKVIKE